MDLLGLVGAIPWTALTVLLLVVLPGAAVAPLLAPGTLTPIDRLGRAISAGLLVASLATFALALVGLLRPAVVFALLIGLTILPLHGRRPSWPRRPAVMGRRGWAIGLGLAGAAIVVAPAFLAGPGGGSGLLPADWSAALSAAAVAERGGFPIVAPAWATERVLSTANPAGVSHLAAFLQLLPGDLAARLAIDRLTVASAVVLVAAMLFRRWLPSWAALVGGALFAGIGSVTSGILDDPAATRILILGLFSIWLADRALVERRRRLVLAAGLTMTVCFIGQPDIFLAAGSAIAGLAVARWLVAPGGGPENAGGLGHRYGRRLGLRLALARPALAPIAVGALVVALGAGLGGIADRALGLVAPAEGILGTATPGGPDGDPFVGVGEVPAGWRDSGDETWDLRRALEEIETAPADAPGGPDDPRFLRAAAAGLLGAPIGLSPAGLPALPFMVGGALVLPIVGWPLLDARRQRLVLALLGFGLILGLVAVAIVVRDGSFADRWIAALRLLPLHWLVAAAALGFAGRAWAGAVTAGAVRLVGDRLDGRAAGRFVVAAALVSAIVTFAGASAMLVGAARASVDRPGSLSDRGLEVYTWIARAAPLDARILANGSTSGVIALLGRRTGIIDGPVVDGRDRPVLARATGLALGARVVFADPDGDRAATYLAREGVTHLLVAGPAATAADLGARAVIPADAAAIDASHRFGLVRSFGDRVFLYEVLALP